MSFDRVADFAATNKGFSRFRRMPLGVAAFAAALHLVPLGALAGSDHDCGDDPHFAAHADCGVHNMMLVGVDKAYLSHLPMFDFEHRFQVIFEATFAEGEEDLSALYTDDRGGHPEVGMYTVNPGDLFVLPRLFDEAAGSRRIAFSGTVFRGHFERPGRKVIDGLEGVDVEVNRVIYARELHSDADKPGELRYILFGDGEELFLAHEITRPPDFDQIVAVEVDDRRFTADELENGVVVSVPGRANSAKTRLRADDRVEAVAEVGESAPSATLRIEVLSEPYFEEGELLVPPTFAPTPLEIEAGF